MASTLKKSSHSNLLNNFRRTRSRRPVRIVATTTVTIVGAATVYALATLPSGGGLGATGALFDMLLLKEHGGLKEHEKGPYHAIFHVFFPVLRHRRMDEDIAAFFKEMRSLPARTQTPNPTRELYNIKGQPKNPYE